MTALHVNTAGNHGAAKRLTGHCFSHVNDRCDVNPLLLQCKSSEIAIVIAGQNYRAIARLYGVVFHQSIRGAAHHDAGQIVVTKDYVLFKRPGCHNNLSGSRFVHALTLNDRQVVVCKPAVTGGIGEHLNAAVL